MDQADLAERLNRARQVLDRAARVGLAGAGAAASSPRSQAQAVPGAGVVAVDPVLAELFPGGGLPRGSTVTLARSNALLLSLLAYASSNGVWCAVVGLGDLGVVAASEAGLDLSKTALIPNPGDQLLPVLSALIDGLDLLAVAGTERLRAADRQRLSARCRQRGAVLLPVGAWPGADLHVEAIHIAGGWQGLGGPGQGHGRLRERRTQITVTGRGAARAPRTALVLLPRPTGAVTLCESPRRGQLSAVPAGKSDRRAS